MAQTLQVRLARNENSPWGFRLHGGVDFGSPLIIQKVNYRSLSESAGLQPGDVIVAINGNDITGCRHKEAQEAIVKAGHSFQLTIQRGAITQQTWKPQVTPVGDMPTKPTPAGQVFTKTSLAATKQEDTHWDVKHNQAAKGFATPPAQNGGFNSSTPKAQSYNNPSGLYSEDTIKEVLNQQAETLATGVKGINFHKSELQEKPVPGEIAHSETLRMVRDLDQSKDSDYEQGEEFDPCFAPSHHKGLTNKNVQSASFRLLQKALESNNNNNTSNDEHDGSDLSLIHSNAKAPKIKDQSNFRSVAAPITKPRPEGQPSGPPLSLCAQCGRLITGVFCKVRGQPLHAECFTCAACNCPLKNVGHFVVDDKLYCEPHARAAKAVQQIGHQVANNPPMPKPQVQSIPQQQNNQNQSNLKSNDQWNEVLNSNSAGIASNAEDFTKQFMAQMYGGEKAVPATVTQNKYPSTSSPMMNRAATSSQGFNNNQQSSTPAKTQGILKVSNTDDIITSSNRPKKETNKNLACQKSDSSDLAVPPQCFKCKSVIDRGPFITALGRTWCPGHFVCSQGSCGRSLQESGFVEEQGHLYCEDCYGKYLAPDCEKCRRKILGNCLRAMGKTFHPECFVCAYCGKIFANSPFYLEDGLPYCEEDWNELFTTKCVSCGFPIEAGDRWVEALNNNYHSQCFNCTLCKKNLEGKGFFVKAGKPFCKSHAKTGV